MSTLDAMTKDELLAYAQEHDITPANTGMTKADILASIQAAEGGPSVEEQATTTKTKDFLNRPLVNATPGTSQATDYLGRAVVAGDKDHIGRSLVT